MAPFDCFVLGYCLYISAGLLTLVNPPLEIKKVEMLVRGTLECQLQFTGSILHLTMGCDITSVGLKYLLKLPIHLLGGRLEELDLSLNRLDSESCLTPSQQ